MVSPEVTQGGVAIQQGTLAPRRTALKRSHLATVIRIRLVEFGLLTERAVSSITDRDIIESYNLCSTCMEPVFPLEYLWGVIRRSPGPEEFMEFFREHEARSHPFEIECEHPVREQLQAVGITPETLATSLAEGLFETGAPMKAGYVQVASGPLYYLYSRQGILAKPVIILVSEEEYCRVTGDSPAPAPEFH